MRPPSPRLSFHRWRLALAARKLLSYDTVEIVLIVTGAIAAVGAVVSAVATILDLRATRKSVKLAEDQARTRPSIEISLELLDVREVDDVWELVKYVLEARQRKVEKERKEREEKEKQKREAQKRQERT